MWVSSFQEMALILCFRYEFRILQNSIFSKISEGDTYGIH